MVDQTATDTTGTATTAAPRIFLSYTRDDLQHAGQIIALLENAGFDVWWDGLLDGGETYLPTTEAALENADCVVVLWSKKSINSNWVRDEAQSGRERGCLVPLSLDGTMAPLGFRQIQLIDISAWNGDGDSAEARKILGAVKRQTDPQGSAKIDPAPRPSSSPASNRSGISRRAMVAGGVAIAAAAGIGGWQAGLFGSPDAAPLPMAVLRFANLTGDDRQAWFSDGLSNELRQVLSRNPLLRVSAPTSSTSDVEKDDFALGRALGVESIVRGSVQRAGETVRIFAELVEIEGGVVRWSESYDRALDDVLALQSEIADTVAFALVTQITTEKAARQTLEQQHAVGGTTNVAAYEAYLQGRAFLALAQGAESDRAGLERLQEAVEIDPAYASAHAWKSTALAAIANVPEDASERSRLIASAIAAARQSISIEPRLAEGHMALGLALGNGKLDFPAALSHLKRAQKLAPGDVPVQANAAVFFAYGGQHEQATRIIDDVLKRDPLNARAFRAAGFIALLGHDYAATVARMEQALALSPKIASANWGIGNALYFQGDARGAVKAFEAEAVPTFNLTGLAIAHAKLGNVAAAQASLDALLADSEDKVPYQQAQVYAQWGQGEKAIAALRQAFEKGDPGVLWAIRDPMLDPIRSDPAFAELLKPLTT